MIFKVWNKWIKKEIKDYLFIHKAQDKYPFKDKEFDLVISLGCLHNLRIFELETALKEIERVGNKSYLMLESYRSEKSYSICNVGH